MLQLNPEKIELIRELRFIFHILFILNYFNKEKRILSIYIYVCMYIIYDKKRKIWIIKNKNTILNKLNKFK